MQTTQPPPPPPTAYPTYGHTTSGASEHETSWRSKFPKIVVLILSIIQLCLTVLIFILEIASLAVYEYSRTGVGIWCAVPFSIACILTFITCRKDGSRVWATRAFIAQIVLLVFTFILIGITGNFVQTYGISDLLSIGSASSLAQAIQSYPNKYRIVQAQLAFGILLMFSGFVYVGIYIYVTIVALWQPFHTLDTPHLFRA